MIKTSIVADSVKLSLVRSLFNEAKKYNDVIDFTLGDPDVQPHQAIKDAACDAIQKGKTRYSQNAGLIDLRKTISTYYERKEGFNFNPETEVMVTVGAMEGLYLVLLSMLNPGDEVIIPTPCWVSYSEMVKIAGGKNVFVKTTAETDYKLTTRQLQKAITERTKLLILCSPNNPTGSVYTQDELAALVEVLKNHPNIFVIADEVYSALVYGIRHVSLASFVELADRLILVKGVSKTYAMTGYRIGWMACHNNEIVRACTTLQGQYLTCACLVAQRAAEAALTGPQNCVEMMRTTYAQRRMLILSLLDEIPDITYNTPDGAFYIFPNVSLYYGKHYGDQTIANSDDMVNYLLNEAHVACVAGSAYGEDNCIRLSFATDEKNIIEALRRIKKALTILN